MKREFPPGTDEARLSSELRGMKFEILGRTCGDLPLGDPSIRSAVFAQSWGSLLNPAMRARIDWKVDEHDRLVWSHALVTYEDYGPWP